MFKASRETGAAGGGVLRRIAEEAQFCGWYLCGIDTTTSAQDDWSYHREDANAVSAKKARKKAAELTFLGREIEVCGGGGGSGKSVFCVQL